MFLIEEGRKLPYFAAKISDISSVQSGVKINEDYSKDSDVSVIYYMA